MGLGKAIGWVAAAIIKFMVTPSIMISAGNSFLYTWIITSIGAAIGFALFYYLGSAFFNYLNSHRKKQVVLTKRKIKFYRFILKNGIKGLMLISLILSVPVTAIIASRFFSHHKMIVPLFMGVFCVWAFILTSLSLMIRTAL